MTLKHISVDGYLEILRGYNDGGASVVVHQVWKNGID